MSSNFPKSVTVPAGPRDGYVFEISVAVGRTIVCVAMVTANTFDEAKQLVQRSITLSNSERLLPTIQLDQFEDLHNR